MSTKASNSSVGVVWHGSSLFQKDSCPRPVPAITDNSGPVPASRGKGARPGEQRQQRRQGPRGGSPEPPGRESSGAMETTTAAPGGDPRGSQGAFGNDKRSCAPGGPGCAVARLHGDHHGGVGEERPGDHHQPWARPGAVSAGAGGGGYGGGTARRQEHGTPRRPPSALGTVRAEGAPSQPEHDLAGRRPGGLSGPPPGTRPGRPRETVVGPGRGGAVSARRRQFAIPLRGVGPGRWGWRVGWGTLLALPPQLPLAGLDATSALGRDSPGLPGTGTAGQGRARQHAHEVRIRASVLALGIRPCRAAQAAAGPAGYWTGARRAAPEPRNRRRRRRSCARLTGEDGAGAARDSPEEKGDMGWMMRDPSLRAPGGDGGRRERDGRAATYGPAGPYTGPRCVCARVR